jgi:hypothetical protein
MIPADNRRVSRADQADFPGNRNGGVRMVARHHDDLDPSLAAFVDRHRHFRAGRILEANQPEKNQILLQHASCLVGGHLSRGEGQNALSLLGHRLFGHREFVDIEEVPIRGRPCSRERSPRRFRIPLRHHRNDDADRKNEVLPEGEYAADQDHADKGVADPRDALARRSIPQQKRAPPQPTG